MNHSCYVTADIQPFVTRNNLKGVRAPYLCTLGSFYEYRKYAAPRDKK